MQSAGVLVGVFISLCLRLCAVDSSNLTKTSAAIGNRRQNESFAFGDPTNEAEEHPVAADEAQVTERTDVLDGGTEGHRITPKWESGNFIVMSIFVITALIYIVFTWFDCRSTFCSNLNDFESLNEHIDH